MDWSKRFAHLRVQIHPPEEFGFPESAKILFVILPLLGTTLKQQSENNHVFAIKLLVFGILNSIFIESTYGLEEHNGESGMPSTFH